VLQRFAETRAGDGTDLQAQVQRQDLARTRILAHTLISTAATIGAEGLSKHDGDTCALADAPADFAAKTIALLNAPAEAAALAEKARQHVLAHWDMATITKKLADSYREVIVEKRKTTA
jgi:glycosyltransferase involved in cell wall biosynthesis